MPKPTYHPTLPIRWNQLTLDCIVATATPPPFAARILAIVHTAMYDAWAAYDDVALGSRMAGLLRRRPEDRTEEACAEAMSYAAYQVLKTYFLAALPADKKTLLDDLMGKLEYDPTNTTEDPTTPAGLGNLAAKVLLDYRRGDGSNCWNALGGAAPYADYTGYAPALPPLPQATTLPFDSPTGALLEHWQPLHLDGKPKPQQFLAPHWGLVQPFALRNGAEFRPMTGPERWYTPRFKAQCEQVIRYSAELDDNTKSIAEYWSDGPNSVTPPGHWCVLAQQVARRDRHDANQDVQMFFVLANGLLDASIACWDSKRAFDYARPVTMIRHLFKGQEIDAWGGPAVRVNKKMQGEQWQPYQAAGFVTPPFPEFTSGHSTFSAASAEILKRFTGSDHFGYGVDIDQGTSKIEPGQTPSRLIRLEWNTFSQAATEAGLSRLYGGIHFEDANLQGQELGRKVGEKVWNKAARLWGGIS